MNRNSVAAEDYGLVLAGMIEGEVTAVPLYGLTPTTHPETGTAYTPFTEIPPQSVHILQLLPQE
jgi:hypothetical protein